MGVAGGLAGAVHEDHALLVGSDSLGEGDLAGILLADLVIEIGNLVVQVSPEGCVPVSRGYLGCARNVAFRIDARGVAALAA